MSIKIALISLGCAKNLVDSELMLGILKENECEIITNAKKADVVIINTCGFIESAKKEAIEQILEIIALKKENYIKEIIVTGCLSQRYKDEIEKEFPEVKAFLGTGSYNEIYKAVKNVLNGEKYIGFKEREDHSIDGQRVLSTPSYTAYLKISEGCDNCCSYCAIPLIRGKFRSRAIQNIVNEARLLAKRGVKELCVIAQDTTRYGLDLYGEYKICTLLKELAKIDEIKWIRLLYCYPERITDELIDLIASEEKIVKYIEMPVQHASDKILKLMNRSGDFDFLINLVDKIKCKIPNCIIRTSLIVGFPGETKKDFGILCDFVKKARFHRLGVFCYSKEEGTASFDLKGHLSESVKLKRQEIVLLEQNQVSFDFNQSRVFKSYEVLVEGYDKKQKKYIGRSFMEAPEIDGKIIFYSIKDLKEGDFVNVSITNALDYDLLGEAVFED